MAVSWRTRRFQVRARRWGKRYGRHAWKPIALCIGMLMLGAIVQLTGELLMSAGGWRLLGGVLAGLCAIAFVGLMGATVWNLLKKRLPQSLVSVSLLIFFCYALNLTIANHFLFTAVGAHVDDVPAIAPVETEIEAGSRSVDSPAALETPTDAAELPAKSTLNRERLGHNGRMKRLREHK